MAPQHFTHWSSLMMDLHQGSFAAPTPKKNLADVTASSAISLCSLGRASHEYEESQ